jgi:hypothetical protein
LKGGAGRQGLNNIHELLQPVESDVLSQKLSEMGDGKWVPGGCLKKGQTEKSWVIIMSTYGLLRA